VLGSDLKLTGKRKNNANQWKWESAGKGFYKILNRENVEKILECTYSGQDIMLSNFTGKDSQIWKIDDAYNGLYKISNKQFPNMMLSLNEGITKGNRAGLLNAESGSSFGWKLLEVCDIKYEPFKPHTIPGTVEAEDFDIGCPGDAYFDVDENNQGGQYRPNEGVDIEKCSAGGYSVGWTRKGEWMAYTVTVSKSASYQVSFYIASASDGAKMHLECDDIDKTGIVSIPNTDGYQNWGVVNKIVNLDAGEHLLKLIIDADGLNIDKIVFTEIK
jgi:hypothetical protein